MTVCSRTHKLHCFSIISKKKDSVKAVCHLQRAYSPLLSVTAQNVNSKNVYCTTLFVNHLAKTSRKYTNSKNEILILIWKAKEHLLDTIIFAKT